LDVLGAESVAAARIMSTATTGTALITTGRVGVNNASPSAPLDVTGNAILRNLVRIGSNAEPTVPLDVAGAAKIAGELNMSSNKIVNLVNPTNAQDAATKRYVELATTDMATSSSVSTAITNALGSSGTDTNRPSVERGDYRTGDHYLTYVDSSDLAPSNNSSKRGLLRNDSMLAYRPDRLTLYTPMLYVSGPGTFIGPILAKGGTGYDITGTGRYWNYSGDTGAAPGLTAQAMSIVADYSIWTKGTHIWVTSDQRIKTNIVNLNADKMINVFRTLRPISFDYIDPMKNSNKKHFGFIAQEVNEILPEGISLNTDVIPNNMLKGEIDQKSKIETSFTLKPTDTDITLQYLLLTTETPLIFDISNSYSSTNIYKFKIYGGKEWSKEQDIYIRSDYNVTDDKYTYVIGMKKEVYDVVITEATLFVYGQYVNDLHILDHDTIYTVATAALQEVDRQQQADKARIAELENHVSNLESTVAAQQSLINDILERLKTLEKA
jgi:hypothetical protein